MPHAGAHAWYWPPLLPTFLSLICILLLLLLLLLLPLMRLSPRLPVKTKAIRPCSGQWLSGALTGRAICHTHHSCQKCRTLSTAYLRRFIVNTRAPPAR